MSEVQIKNLPESIVASVTHIGPYWETYVAFQKLHEWISKNQVKPKGNPAGLYYDNPKEIPLEKLRSEAIIEVDGNSKGEGEVEIKILPPTKCACLLYKGSYADVGKRQAYLNIADFLKNNGLVYDESLPIREIYLNNPTEVKPEDLETEIQMPVK